MLASEEGWKARAVMRLSCVVLSSWTSVRLEVEDREDVPMDWSTRRSRPDKDLSIFGRTGEVGSVLGECECGDGLNVW
jgi:hypothetical protein